MAVYLKEFSTHSEYDAYINGSDAMLPNVSICTTEEDVYYNPYVGPSGTYFTTSFLGDGNIKFSGSTSGETTNVLSYSRDKGKIWQQVPQNENISVTNGEKIIWKGITTPYYSGIGKFSASTQFNVEGNVMSLTYGDDFKNKTDLSSKEKAFYALFKDCTTLVSAENLVLPATVLSTNCYYEMFRGCYGMTKTIKELPATNLSGASYCYRGMFYNCNKLTEVPELPATTLADYCYNEMFYNCSKLANIPELPATELNYGCYNGMFYYCTSMVTPPELPATTLANYCYSEMFMYCTSMVTPPDLPATTLAESCYNRMFGYCSNMTSLPNISATTLASGCYNRMFDKCDSITEIPANYLPITNLARSCYNGMFSHCNGLVSVPTNLLPAETTIDWCYASMFSYCENLVNPPALPAQTLTDSCYYNMFAYCTSLEVAPDLTAPKLVTSCYPSMFSNCSKLRYIKCLSTNTPPTNSLASWVTGVAATGTFVKSSSGYFPTGAGGIPSGWTVEIASS